MLKANAHPSNFNGFACIVDIKSTAAYLGIASYSFGRNYTTTRLEEQTDIFLNADRIKNNNDLLAERLEELQR